MGENRWRALLLALLLLFPLLGAQAQKASVQATVEPAEIQIGEQALVNLKIIAPKGKIIHFPVYESQIVPGLEVLAMPKPDTLIENNVMTMNVKYIVTSFDSTLYYVPSMPISDGADTIYSNSFGLKVVSPALKDSTLAYLEKMNSGQTDSVDFNQLQLNDIKPVQKPPFVLGDYLWVMWIFLGILLLLLAIGFVVYLILKKKKKGYFFTPPVVLPPHVRAIQALDKLKEEKIWQHGREKEFYTKITDILRRYIFDRYGINAMEMTSGEILNEIRKETDIASVYENLKQILSVSDLVKFAKYKPFTDENDLSMMNAYFFVNQTREPDPVPKKEDEPDGPKKEEQAG